MSDEVRLRRLLFARWYATELTAEDRGDFAEFILGEGRRSWSQPEPLLRRLADAIEGWHAIETLRAQRQLVSRPNVGSVPTGEEYPGGDAETLPDRAKDWTPAARSGRGRARPSEPLATWCEAHLPCCTGRAQVRHHKLRRSRGGSDAPENTTDICARCHDWIHAHPADAYQLGLLIRGTR